MTWPETVTWNTFGGDPGVNTDEYANLIGDAPATTRHGLYGECAGQPAALVCQPGLQLGWVIKPTTTDGVKVWSSEYTTATDRPKLTVEYISGPVTCYALTLSHTGNGADPTASPANSAGCQPVSTPPALDYADRCASFRLAGGQLDRHDQQQQHGDHQHRDDAGCALARFGGIHRDPPANWCARASTAYTTGSAIGTYTGWYDGSRL